MGLDCRWAPQDGSQNSVWEPEGLGHAPPFKETWIWVSF